MTARVPLLHEDLQTRLSAFVMAYLPGSEGGTALADALYGRAACPLFGPAPWRRWA